ncbi:glycosyltransferase family 4 protein [bacterium]|nr:glycosyltransferase family 4 protein [bacterium]
MRSKNILELCLSPDLGGLELYMVRASHFLDDKTKVISVISEAGKLEQYYKNTPFKYEKIQRHSTLLSFVSAKKLAKIIDENAIDVVHLHWTKDIPVAVLAKLFSKRKPKLVQTRNMTMTRFKDDFYHRFLYKNMDLMLPVTYQVKEQLEKFIPADIRPKVEVLYMGAETPEFIEDAQKQKLRAQYGLSDVFTVGIVGRIEDGKGQYLVIEAVKKLLGEGVNVQALIVGHAMNDEYLQSLKEGVKQENLEQKIIFTGFTREAQKLMQLCDTLVLATDRETFGLVLIEAMACGICVIGTNNAGPLEIIDDHQTGLLFNKRDSDDLAEKIKLLAEDETLRNALARSGKMKANEVFESKKQFEKLYKILCD